jgi:methylmalonyl-CoA carboxyltransferase large subunit
MEKPMPVATEDSRALLEAIAELRDQIASLSQRLTTLEHPAQVAPTAAAAPPPQPTPEEPLTEETVLAIAAAIAAYLGKRARIRQIRLVGSTPWAQQGRVSIQASHHLDLFH